MAVQAVEGGRELDNRRRRGRESGVSRRDLNGDLLLMAKHRVAQQEATEVRLRQGNARPSAASDRRLKSNDVRGHRPAAAAARLQLGGRPLDFDRRRSVKGDREVGEESGRPGVGAYQVLVDLRGAFRRQTS